MDISLNPASGVIRFQTPSVPTANPTPDTTASVQQALAQDTVVTSASIQTAVSSSASNSKAIQSSYQEAIQQIAASFKDTYAVSDKQFSLFKDASGKVVTRYVSLRDGSITYVPAAPVVVKPATVMTHNIAITA